MIRSLRLESSKFSEMIAQKLDFKPFFKLSELTFAIG
jgi:hypothetical protein